MAEIEMVEIELHIYVPDSTEEELDHLTRQLLAEIKDTDIESVELKKNSEIPEGAKGDPVTIGTILLVSLPSTLPKIIELVQAWSLRGNNRIVKFKGKGIEFEGSAEELHKLLTKLEKGRKKA